MEKKRNVRTANIAFSKATIFQGICVVEPRAEMTIKSCKNNNREKRLVNLGLQQKQHMQRKVHDEKQSL